GKVLDLDIMEKVALHSRVIPRIGAPQADFSPRIASQAKWSERKPMILRRAVAPSSRGGSESVKLDVRSTVSVKIEEPTCLNDIRRKGPRLEQHPLQSIDDRSVSLVLADKADRRRQFDVYGYQEMV
ncbi:hypothetical protein ACE1XZ_22470, partial [Bacillus subtilis]|uniref:hypothetical protein n=1 Tax=Bacillus subtilis TaxID=1423 RepID=UPI0035C10EB9